MQPDAYLAALLAEWEQVTNSRSANSQRLEAIDAEIRKTRAALKAEQPEAERAVAAPVVEKATPTRSARR